MRARTMTLSSEACARAPSFGEAQDEDDDDDDDAQTFFWRQHTRHTLTKRHTHTHSYITPY